MWIRIADNRSRKPDARSLDCGRQIGQQIYIVNYIIKYIFKYIVLT